MTHYLDFVDLKYKPGKNDLICQFYLEPAKGITFKEAAGRVAAESSNGTWSDLGQTTLTSRIREMRGRCYEIHGNRILVAYPEILFERGSMPQILSSVAGNIFGMKAVNNLRLEDIHFPKLFVKAFKGPQFGIKGVRKFMKVEKRPMTCTVPKPKIGMTTKEHAYVGHEAWMGGVDFLKCDENLTSQRFNPFDKRAKVCFKVRDQVEKKTKERKSYFINVTAETKEMIRRAELVKKCGGEYIMIDIMTAGFAALQTMRNTSQDFKLAIHAHRAMHAAMDRNPKHGMSMLVIAKMARLIGVDSLHVGTVVGKLVGTKQEVEILRDAVTKDKIKGDGHILPQEWYGMKPVIPVSSGGLHPGLVPKVMDLFGTDCVVQLGGGMHAHNQGTRQGAVALRQAISAYMHKVPLREAAKHQEALASALKKWGTETPI